MFHKYFLTAVFCVLILSCASAFTYDGFEDGDYTNNPTWTIVSGSYSVNTNGSPPEGSYSLNSSGTDADISVLTIGPNDDQYSGWARTGSTAQQGAYIG